MDITCIKTYLKILIDMEETNETLIKTIQDLKTSKEKLDREYYIPTKPQKPIEPQKPSNTGWTYLLMVAGGIIIFILGLRNIDNYFWGSLLALLLGVVGVFCGCLITLDEVGKSGRNNEENYKKALSAYEDSLSRYEAQMTAYENRFTNEIQYKTKNKFLEQEIQLLESKQFSTNKLLQKIQNINPIHPNYRYPQALKGIYDILDIGRTDTLEGPFGAYNIFSSENRNTYYSNWSYDSTLITKTYKFQESIIVKSLLTGYDSLKNDMKNSPISLYIKQQNLKELDYEKIINQLSYRL